MAMKKYISWRRVSTFRQGASGLGLEAQRNIIEYFVKQNDGELIADYSECYTGKELSGCVELRKAMMHAKRDGACLIIAKTDRFRNCQEALSILDDMGEGCIEFCDLPHSDRFTLTLFWALAEREALITSIRTKQALAVKKAAGFKLGAGSDKYRASRAAKSKDELVAIDAKKGVTRTQRHLESRDIQTFIKVLQRVFPDACVGNIDEWQWQDINTCKENRWQILHLMEDYRDIDGSLFEGWDFSDIMGQKMQVKLATYIRSLRVSALNHKKHQNL